MLHVGLTNHARARCAQMDVRTKEVKRAVREPEADYPLPWKGPGYRIAVKGRLAVAYDVRDGRAVVMTVLWHGTESRDQQPNKEQANEVQ